MLHFLILFLHLPFPSIFIFPNFCASSKCFLGRLIPLLSFCLLRHVLVHLCLTCICTLLTFFSPHHNLFCRSNIPHFQSYYICEKGKHLASSGRHLLSRKIPVDYCQCSWQQEQRRSSNNLILLPDIKGKKIVNKH